MVYALKKVSLVRALVWLSVIPLILAAFWFILLPAGSGGPDSIMARITFFALSFGGHSLALLFCVILEQRRHSLRRRFALASVIVVAASFVYSVWFIFWQIPEDTYASFREGLLYTLLILSVSVAQACCLLIIVSPRSRQIRILLFATLSLIAAVALLSIVLIFWYQGLSFVPDEQVIPTYHILGRILLMLVVLDILGMLSLPLLNQRSDVVGGIFRKNAIRALVLLSFGSLGTAAVLISIFGLPYYGDGDQFTWTMLSLGGHSLAILCFAIFYEKSDIPKERLLSLAAIVLAVLSQALVLLVTWDVAEGGLVFRLTGILVVLTLSGGQACCLLLLAPSKNERVRNLRTVTLSLITIVAFLALIMVIFDGGGAYPLLAALLLLDLLGTLLLPVLNHFYNTKEPEPQVAE